MNWVDIKYFFKRKYQQIQRVIEFVPIIWKGYDFDYMYSVELFKKSLDRQAKLFESDELNSDRSKQNASRIRTAIQLMDKVYNEDYGAEWIDILEKKYGSNVLDFWFEDTGEGDGSTFLRREYEKWDNSKEIEEVQKKLLSESREKEKRAHKLLWDFIEHNIQYWWD
jgi:hypothetical protein